MYEHSRWTMYYGHLWKLKTKTSFTVLLRECQDNRKEEVKGAQTYLEYSRLRYAVFGLMFDIHDMSNKDKVFSSAEGLKLWGMTKLSEQRV